MVGTEYVYAPGELQDMIILILVISGVLVGLSNIFNIIFSGHNRAVNHIVDKILENSKFLSFLKKWKNDKNCEMPQVKKCIETIELQSNNHEERLKNVETRVCEMHADSRDFFLLLLENSLRRYFYKLKGNFDPSIYKEGFVPQLRAYKEKGGNGIADKWDKILGDMYVAHMRE